MTTCEFSRKRSKTICFPSPGQWQRCLGTQGAMCLLIHRPSAFRSYPSSSVSCPHPSPHPIFAEGMWIVIIIAFHMLHLELPEDGRSNIETFIRILAGFRISLP